MDGGDGAAADQEIRRLLSEVARRGRAADRAARAAEQAAQALAVARMNLALRAMANTSELERARSYALGQEISPALILQWAEGEASSSSRQQRRRWRPIRRATR